MSVSLDDFKNRPRQVNQNRVPQIKGAVQEAVRMAALTGSADWDMYLRYVEANIKATERMIEQKRNQAASLVLVDEAGAKAAAVIAATLAVKLETLTELILLPKWIIENGEAAKKLVAELEASV